MAGFVFGVVVAAAVNIVTALFSRETGLVILPWLMLYVLVHGTAVAILRESFQARLRLAVRRLVATKWTRMLSYVFVMCCSALLGGVYWWLVNAAARVVEDRTAQPKQTTLMGRDSHSEETGAGAYQGHQAEPASAVARDQRAAAPPVTQERDAHQSQEKTMVFNVRQLFLRDFQDLGSGVGFTYGPSLLEKRDGGHIKVESRLLIDGDSGTKFIAFYVPSDRQAVAVCAFIADHYGKIVNVDGVRAIGEIPGQGPLDSRKYQFSRRIFIYHEDVFTPEEAGGLYGLYKERNLLLELRGSAYAQFMTLRSKQTNNIQRQ